MSLHFSTDAVAPRERYAYWKDAVCATFARLDLDCDARSPFHADLVVRHCRPNFDAIDVRGSAQRVRRGTRLIREDHAECLIVMLQAQGEGVALQDDREFVLSPRALTLLDSRRPYSLAFSGEFRQTVIKLPVALLEERLGRGATDAAVGLVAGNDAALDRLTRMALAELAGHESAPADAPLEGIAFDLLLLSLARAGFARETPPRMAAMRVAWAKAMVAASLCDPTLTPARVAQAQGVSPRLLQRLFAAEGENLCAFILEQRLARCAEALQDAAQARRSITEIALAWGFNDPAHFAKAFRRRYGCTPSERRAARPH